MERDTGPCTDYRAVWYFEPVKRECRRFLYGGCHGNANRFSSEDECRSLCLQHDVTTTVTQTTWSVTWPDDNHRHQADDSVGDIYGQCNSLAVCVFLKKISVCFKLR